LALDELERAWPGGFQRWRSDPEYRPPGGESQVQLAERALDVVRELDRVHDGTALLCTHGGVIRSATASLLRLPKDQWLCLSSVGNCHWTVFARQDVGGRWRLATYNGGLPE
jgi:2,3-bisphosphoglycerate-dependent phosphoglycerate mutase/probable phosphoglycerate mutase